MRSWCHAFVTAWRLLTRIPWPGNTNHDEKTQGRSVVFYPLVGLVLGASLFALASVTQGLPDLAASWVLLAWVLLTGALHLDGLADSADAWLGGHGDHERSLKIMKDPVSGPAGVTAVVLLLLIKFVALGQLLKQGDLLVLLLVPVFARIAVVLLFLTTDYVRAGGMGDAASRHLPRATAWLMCLLVLAAALFLYPRLVVTLTTTMVVTLFALRWLMIKRIGGTTGDTAGASIEIVEAATLNAAVVYSVL